MAEIDMDNWCEKMMQKFYDKQTNPILKFFLFTPLLFYCVLETMAQAVAYTLFPSHKSFAREASTSRNGTYKQSYARHKRYKSGLRYYATGGFMVLIASAFVVFLVTFHLFPPQDIKPARAATFIVSNTNDSGAGSLRQAIASANGAGRGPHVIDIQTSGTLNLLSGLPSINVSDVTIQATSAPGSFNIDGGGLPIAAFQVWNNNFTLDGGPNKYIRMGNCNGPAVRVYMDNAVIRNVYVGTLDGVNPAPNNYGIFLNPGNFDFTLTDSVVSGNTNHAVGGYASNNLVYTNNHIGVSADGLSPLPNTGNGIWMANMANSATIENNVVSNNAYGIQARALSGTIRRNKVGTDITGTVAMGNNYYGLFVSAGTFQIGGPNPGFLPGQDSNLISGNGGLGFNDAGIYLATGLTNATIQNNYIGTDINGLNDLGNDGDGIGTYHNNNNHVIRDNIIAYNTDKGIMIAANSINNDISHNRIGINAAGNDAGNGGYGLALVTNSIADVHDNIISGNDGSGLYVTSGQSVDIYDNYIGTDPTGTSSIPNSTGVYISSCVDCKVGVSGRNIISGNNSNGITFSDYSGNTGRIENNYIGVDITGENELGNGSPPGGNGIAVSGTGTFLINGNVVSGSGANGIFVRQTTNTSISGNFVGTDKDGETGIANNSNGINLYQNFIDTDVKNNVISANGENGIYGSGGSGVEITQNKIGVNDAGDTALANTDSGIYFRSTMNGRIYDDNTISGNNSHGIDAEWCTDLDIEDNNIGTNTAGDTAIPNADGIHFSYSSGTIGGTPAERNVISGNSGYGIILDTTMHLGSATVQNNYLGVAADGSTAMANSGEGVIVYEECDGSRISDNIIAHHGGDGVVLRKGGSWGNDVSKYVTISENSIFNNSDVGIGLEDSANEGINPPTITDIRYNPGPDTYDVEVNTEYSGGTVELYWDADGEGRTYLGSQVAASSVSFNVPGPKPAGYDFTATVTNTNGSTSQFGGPDSTPPTTTADPSGGTYLIPVTVTLDSTDDFDPSPTIYYTTDGSTPDSGSDSCVETCDIDISSSATLKFYAEDNFGNKEAVKTEDYVISSSPSGKGLKLGVPVAKNIGASTAEIYWTSNKLADSRVYYGPTSGYGSSEYESADVTTHSVELTGLSPSTTYHFKVRSVSAAGESKSSADYTFTTYAKDVAPPEITLTNPEEGYGFLTEMVINGEKIEFEFENGITKGKNRLYIEDDEGVDQKVDKAKIGSDGKAELEVDPDNEFLKNDNNTFKGDARKPDGNTSVKEAIDVAFGSTAAVDNIDVAPRRADRDPGMTNTTTDPRPTIGSYLPLSGLAYADATVQMWSRNSDQPGYVYEGDAQITGGSDASGMISFKRTFWVAQPPGPVSLYFRLIDSSGIEYNRTDEFTIVHYKPCFVEFKGTVENDASPQQPVLVGNSCIGWPVKVYIDGSLNGEFTPSENNFAYTPFLPLDAGSHSVEFVTWEADGLPSGSTYGTIEVGEAAIAVAAPAPPAPEEGVEPGVGAAPEEAAPEEGVEEAAEEAEAEEEEAVSEEEAALEEELDRADDLTEEEYQDLLERMKELGGKKWLEFGTQELIELTPEEEAELEKALQESLEKGAIALNIRGATYAGQTVDGVTKFCIRRCLRPSLLDEGDAIEIGGVLDIPENLDKKLTEAGAQAQVAANVGGAVRISRVNRTGEWTMSVPLSQLPDGDHDIVTKASMNGTDTGEIKVAKVQAQKEPVISNTSILIFANVGLGLIALVVGGVIYQRRRRTQIA